MNQASTLYGVFWHLAPVVVITSKLNNKINGQVAVTLITSSIVHTVPRLLVGIWKGNYTHEFITGSGKFVVHLLKKDQFYLVKNFGFTSGRDRNKFSDVDFFDAGNECPVVKGTHSYMECRVLNAMDGGDMTVFLVEVSYGEVLEGGQWMTLDDFYSDAPQEWIAEYGYKLHRSVQFSLPIINNISHEPYKP